MVLGVGVSVRFGEEAALWSLPSVADIRPSLKPASSRSPDFTPQMRSPTMWLGIAGGFLMSLLLYMGVKGALIIGIM